MIYRFCGFSLDDERHELARPDGTRVELQAKVEGVLTVLLENAGLTVSKDELLDQVWHDVTTTEGSLTRAVHLARQAVARDSLQDPIIHTIRGRGYRLDAAVQIEDPTDREGVADPTPRDPQPRRSWPRRVALAGALLLLTLGVLGRPISLQTIESDEASPDRAIAPNAIAVLRFRDLTAGDQQYFADGIAEEIRHRLSAVPGLRVSGRASSSSPHAEHASPQALRDQLQVGSVLRGSIRLEPPRVRVAAELVRTDDGFKAWSGSFERELGHLLEVQDDIAREIVTAVTGAIASVDPTHVARRRLPDPEAYEHFLRGVYTQNYRDRENLDHAVARFETAVALDPEFADAHAELSRSLSLFAFYVRDDPAHFRALVERAAKMAERAVAIDPNSGPAHTAMAGVLSRRLDWVGAEASFRRAIEVAPSYMASHEALAVALAKMNRLEEARAEFLTALQQDPLSPVAHRQVGRVYYYLGEPTRAIRHLLRALELNPADDDAPRLLSNAYSMVGRELEAGEIFARRYPWPLRAPARIGLRTIGLTRMARLHYALLAWHTGDACLGYPYDAAGILAATGDPETMFECLARSNPQLLSYFNVEPVYAPYRDDPRFKELVRRAGRAPTAKPLEDPAADGGRSLAPPQPGG